MAGHLLSVRVKLHPVLMHCRLDTNLLLQQQIDDVVIIAASVVSHVLDKHTDRVDDLS